MPGVSSRVVTRQGGPWEPGYTHSRRGRLIQPACTLVPLPHAQRRAGLNNSGTSSTSLDSASEGPSGDPNDFDANVWMPGGYISLMVSSTICLPFCMMPQAAMMQLHVETGTRGSTSSLKQGLLKSLGVAVQARQPLRGAVPSSGAECSSGGPGTGATTAAPSLPGTKAWYAEWLHSQGSLLANQCRPWSIAYTCDTHLTTKCWASGALRAGMQDMHAVAYDDGTKEEALDLAQETWLLGAAQPAEQSADPDLAAVEQLMQLRRAPSPQRSGLYPPLDASCGGCEVLPGLGPGGGGAERVDADSPNHSSIPNTEAGAKTAQHTQVQVWQRLY